MKYINECLYKIFVKKNIYMQQININIYIYNTICIKNEILQCFKIFRNKLKNYYN